MDLTNCKVGDRVQNELDGWGTVTDNDPIRYSFIPIEVEFDNKSRRLFRANGTSWYNNKVFDIIGYKQGE